MNTRRFFLTASCVGIMLLNNTAVAHADWGSGDAAINNYSGQIAVSSVGEHSLSDFRRSDGVESGGDSLFGSTSIQSPVTLVAGTSIEIEVMTAGELVNNRYVNGKSCPANKNFNAFVTPIASCSSHFGSNFSGFRAQAEDVEESATEGDGTKWRPMLYMNVKGRWVDLSVKRDGSSSESGLLMGAGKASTPEQCAQVLVQKICQ